MLVRHSWHGPPFVLLTLDVQRHSKVAGFVESGSACWWNADGWSTSQSAVCWERRAGAGRPCGQGQLL